MEEEVKKIILRLEYLDDKAYKGLMRGNLTDGGRYEAYAMCSAMLKTLLSEQDINVDDIKHCPSGECAEKEVMNDIIDIVKKGGVDSDN